MGRQGTSRSDLMRRLAAYTGARRRRRRWLAVLGVLAVAVALCTAYALMMPASTLTWDSADEVETEAAEAAGETTSEDENTVQTASAEEDEATADETSDEVATLPDGAEVPEGYTEQYTVQDEDNGYTVTVYAAEGVVPAGATLSATLLSEDDDAYATAQNALAAEADDDDEYGFAALDIHFEDADGNEVEPEGDVYVVIDAQGLLPEDADADTVTVQHHAESDGDVTVETVADAADETDGVVAVTDETTVQAAFSVDSFSTFTISWSSGSGPNSTTYFRVTVHYVDENGNEIQGTRTSNISANNVSNSNSVTYTFSDYAGDISGYTYSGAHYNSYNGNEVTRMTFSQTTSGEGRNQTTTRTLTFYNGSTQVARLTYNSGPQASTQTADVYLVYTSNSTSGGSTGDGSGSSSTVTSATVTTGKTAVLKDDGTYDLTLSISGDRGSVEQKVAVDIVFILDKSGSMNYRLNENSNATGNQSSRMDYLQNAVGTLVTTIEANENIDARYAAVDFAGASQTSTQSWTNASSITAYVNRLSANGGTNYQAGIYQAKQLLNSAREGAITFVIFVSDGEPTYRGTSSDSGTGSSDPSGYNIDAAVTEISSMSCNYFYAIGMGPSFGTNNQGEYLTGTENLYKLANAVQAANGTGVYSATDETSFTNAFKEITSSITFFAASGVTITDQLSEYAEIVLDASGNPQFTITVTRAAYTDSDGTQHDEQTWTTTTPVGNKGTLTFKDADGNDVTLTASYDETTKTITLEFPHDYELEEGYTYSVSTVIEPSEAANSAGETGYNATGDANTGTHSGQSGFYSNGTAEVTYTANEEEGSAEFPKPVIQVTKTSTVDITVTKVDAQNNDTKLSGAVFYLTRTVTDDNNDESTQYYYYTDGAVTWVDFMEDATSFTSSEQVDDFGTFTINALEDGTYYLVEVTAPDGYQLPSSNFTFTVTNGVVNYVSSGTASNSTTITVTNTTGQKLPETGGTGTTLLTVCGTALVAVAGVGYAVRRNQNKRE